MCGYRSFTLLDEPARKLGISDCTGFFACSCIVDIVDIVDIYVLCLCVNMFECLKEGG